MKGVGEQGFHLHFMLVYLVYTFKTIPPPHFSLLKRWRKKGGGTCLWSGNSTFTNSNHPLPGRLSMVPTFENCLKSKLMANWVPNMLIFSITLILYFIFFRILQFSLIHVMLYAWYRKRFCNLKLPQGNWNKRTNLIDWMGKIIDSSFGVWLNLFCRMNEKHPAY